MVVTRSQQRQIDEHLTDSQDQSPEPSPQHSDDETNTVSEQPTRRNRQRPRRETQAPTSPETDRNRRRNHRNWRRRNNSNSSSNSPAQSQRRNDSDQDRDMRSLSSGTSGSSPRHGSRRERSRSHSRRDVNFENFVEGGSALKLRIFNAKIKKILRVSNSTSRAEQLCQHKFKLNKNFPMSILRDATEWILAFFLNEARNKRMSRELILSKALLSVHNIVSMASLTADQNFSEESAYAFESHFRAMRQSCLERLVMGELGPAINCLSSTPTDVRRPIKNFRQDQPRYEQGNRHNNNAYKPYYNYRQNDHNVIYRRNNRYL